MSKDGTDRLAQFRAERAANKTLGNGVAWLTLAVVIVGFGAILFLLAWRDTGSLETRALEGGLEPRQLREYANYLAGKNMPEQAIEAYENYLAAATLADADRAKVCYTVAKLAVDAEDYDTALAYLYQAEFLDPESGAREEIGKLIVRCLDESDRTVDLRRELRKRTAVERTEEDAAPGDVVLAEFAGYVVTKRDIELEVEKLPAQLRENYARPEQQMELLKNIVAERLLLDKARRLELDKSPEVQEQLAREMDALIVRKLIDDEVQSKVSITPKDVERYYKAEIERFTRPATAQVRFTSADDPAALDGEDFAEDAVTATEGRGIPGVPYSKEALDAIFAAEPGAVTGPVHIDGKHYHFKVESKTPSKVLPFEEVREQAARMLEMAKSQEQFQTLIDETLSARDVKLYPERLKVEDTQP